MIRSRLSLLADFAQVVGTVGVLIGLVFVAMEVRRNTAAVEAATFQELTDASNTWLLGIAADPDLARLWRQGRADHTQLSEVDAVRFYLLMRAWWVRMQNVHSQWLRGTLSDGDWLLYESVICTSAREDPGIVATWEEHKPILTPAFVQFLENCGYRSRN